MSVSRRAFLSQSALAAAVPSLAPGVPAAEAGAEVERLGPDATPLKLKVNGSTRTVEAEPRATLLDVLRWKMGLTGPKEVCDRGACGACTVLVDGKPTLACMTLAADAVDREVTTVEGLGTPDNPNRVQRAFIQHDAVQCGYCIPGFVMSIEGALRANPQAKPDDLRKACSGNLCRCGTYNKVFEAAQRLCGLDPVAGNPEQNSAACLENEASRVDAPEKITGQAVYCADVRRDGMLFAQHVLCPYGEAKLVSGDVDGVKRLPGVVEAEIGLGETYRFSGAPVGHVCASSREALRDAIGALNLQWEPRIVETDARRLHESQHGAFPPAQSALDSESGAREAKAALDRAEVVIERTYTTQIQMHNALEPHGGTVDPTVQPAEGWISTQGTFTCVDALTEGLGLNQEDVQVRCDYVGGGFGAKFGAGREGALAARLAGKYGKPVRVFNDREAEQLDTGNRPGSLQWMKIGADESGKLLGGFVHVAGLVGSGRRGGATNPSRYDFGDVVKVHKDVRAPHGGPRAFRAPGHPQGMFAVESFMDELAEELNIDPVELRLRNETSEVRKTMLPAGAQQIGWERRRPSGSQRGRLRRGLGCGVGDWGSRKGNCAIRMTATPDGKVHVYSGTQDIGQGQRTVIVEVTADELGIDRSRIVVHLANSHYPNGPASGGSTTARLTAPAVRDAAARLKEKLSEARGAVQASARSWDHLPAEGVTAEGSFNDKYWGSGTSDAVQFAEVEVDAETGVVRVEKIVAIQACGLATNRLAVENQIIGGVIQGVSYALFEDRATDPQLGYQMNADLQLYKIAGAQDIPEIVPVIWGRKDGAGVRGLGEPPTIPTAGAIANAVANALGVRVRDLPITPERVLRALEDRA